MLLGLLILLAFQLLGEVLSALLALPVPGPVIGLALLFLALALRGSVPKSLDLSSRGLLGYLGLLFVPAGTGVITHWDLLSDRWVALLVTLILSTLIAMGVTGLTLQALLRRRAGRADRAPTDNGG